MRPNNLVEDTNEQKDNHIAADGILRMGVFKLEDKRWEEV